MPHLLKKIQDDNKSLKLYLNHVFIMLYFSLIAITYEIYQQEKLLKSIADLVEIREIYFYHIDI